MIQRIGKISIPPLPPWTPFAVGGTVVLFFLCLGAILKAPTLPTIRVAFIGNSMQYYNDLPRCLEELSASRIIQNSCLHGDATLTNILVTGNGMYSKWRTGQARIYDTNKNKTKLYDFGACTVTQLLFGYDEELEQHVQEQLDNNNYQDDDNADDDDADDDEYAYDYDDGSNPCLQDINYYSYLNELYSSNPPQFDFVVMNDNTRSPARYESRQAGLSILEEVYVPYFQATGAIPVFLDTHAYWTDWRDLSGLVDVPTFTSLTYAGYLEYKELLDAKLEDDITRVAPVGIAFLTVWEENYSLWLKLFHIDELHASPSGTFLQACVVYHTLYGRMPPKNQAIRDNMSSLWRRARRMQPATHPKNPFPTVQQAEYLYQVADRVVRGHFPKSFTLYDHGEAAYYTPDDSSQYYPNY